MEVQPTQADKRSRNLQQDESSSGGHCEVLLPKREEIVREGDDMVDDCLFVKSCFDSHDAHDENCVDEEIRRDEGARPHVAISWHFTALLVIEECLAIWTGIQEAVESEEAR